MFDNSQKIKNLYPLEGEEQKTKLYSSLYSQYQKLIK